MTHHILLDQAIQAQARRVYSSESTTRPDQLDAHNPNIQETLPPPELSCEDDYAVIPSSISIPVEAPPCRNSKAQLALGVLLILASIGLFGCGIAGFVHLHLSFLGHSFSSFDWAFPALGGSCLSAGVDFLNQAHVARADSARDVALKLNKQKLADLTTGEQDWQPLRCAHDIKREFSHCKEILEVKKQHLESSIKEKSEQLQDNIQALKSQEKSLQESYDFLQSFLQSSTTPSEPAKTLGQEMHAELEQGIAAFAEGTLPDIPETVTIPEEIAVEVPEIEEETTEKTPSKKHHPFTYAILLQGIGLTAVPLYFMVHALLGHMDFNSLCHSDMMGAVIGGLFTLIYGLSRLKVNRKREADKIELAEAIRGIQRIDRQIQENEKAKQVADQRIKEIKKSGEEYQKQLEEKKEDLSQKHKISQEKRVSREQILAQYTSLLQEIVQQSLPASQVHDLVAEQEEGARTLLAE